MRLGPIMALVAACIIGSGTFLVAQDSVARFPPSTLVCFRITLGFLFVIVWFLMLIRPPRLAPRRDWPRLIGLTLFFLVNQFFFIYGMRTAPVVNAALLFACTPILVLIAGVCWLKESLTLTKMAGVLLALAGVLVILGLDSFRFGSGQSGGTLQIAVAVLAWAGYMVVAKSLLVHHKPLVVLCWVFMLASISLSPLTIGCGIQLNWSAPGWGGWIGLAYLGLLTSGISFLLWYWALERMEASRVAVFTNLQPPMTAIMAWAVRGEVLTSQVIIGGVLVLIGVSLAQYRSLPR